MLASSLARCAPEQVMGRGLRRWWMSEAWAAIASNPVATGGLTVLTAGTGLALGRSAVWWCVELVLRRLVVRVEFESKDDSYRWMTAFLAGHEELTETRRYTAATTLSRFGQQMSAEAYPASGFYLIPTGTSLLRFGGKWVMAVRERQDDGGSSGGLRWDRESLTVYVFMGTRRDVEDLVAEARRQYERLCRQRVSIYVVDEYGSWMSAGTRAARPIESVVLADESTGPGLLDDCRTFLEAEALYASRGIPYRRGYLLAGEPGSGKTSLVLALAAELGLPVYVVPADAAALTDAAFADALAGSKAPSVVLIEDIDAAFETSRAAHGGPVVVQTRGARLTLAGLLNALDGALASEGRLLFMTTNHVDRLDLALRRPGRVDVRIDFSHVTADQLLRYAKRFYPGKDLNAFHNLAALVTQNNPHLSMAQLQAAFSQNADSPGDAAAALAAAAGRRSLSNNPARCPPADDTASRVQYLRGAEYV